MVLSNSHTPIVSSNFFFVKYSPLPIFPAENFSIPLKYEKIALAIWNWKLDNE